MKFFEPHPKFITWLVKLAGRRPVIDCGCGEGHVTQALAKRGVNVLGIDSGLFDLRHAIPMNHYAECDARTFPFPDRAIVLFCRPCHSDWVEKTIHNARSRADVILYVGLKDNLERDLGKFAGQFKQIGRNAGKEREGVWWMQRVGSDIVKWCLVKVASWRFPYWVEDSPDYWINSAGGRCPKSPKDKVLESITTDDYALLDHRKTGLFLGYQDGGFLDPGGKMWYCDSREHERYAELILGSSTVELLAQGWCHVYGKGKAWKPNFFCDKELTAEQCNFLRMNGYQGSQLQYDDDVGTPKAAEMLTSDGKQVFSTVPALRKIKKTGD